MNYARVYREFIADRLGKQGGLERFERHHIVPRYFGGGNEPSNIIRLIPEEHLFAHILLAKIYGGAMAVAAICMFGTKRYMGRRSRFKYRRLRDIHRELTRQRMKGKRFRLGTHHSDKTKEKMRSAWTPERLAGHADRMTTPETLERLRSAENLERLNEAPSRLPNLAAYNDTPEAAAQRETLRHSESRKKAQLAWVTSEENLSRLRSPERKEALRSPENLERLLKAATSPEHRRRLRSPEQVAAARAGFYRWVERRRVERSHAE